MYSQTLPTALQQLQKEQYGLLPRTGATASECCSRDLAFGPPGQERAPPTSGLPAPMTQMLEADGGLEDGEVYPEDTLPARSRDSGSSVPIPEQGLAAPLHRPSISRADQKHEDSPQTGRPAGSAAAQTSSVKSPQASASTADRDRAGSGQTQPDPLHKVPADSEAPAGKAAPARSSSAARPPALPSGSPSHRPAQGRPAAQASGSASQPASRAAHSAGRPSAASTGASPHSTSGLGVPKALPAASKSAASRATGPSLGGFAPRSHAEAQAGAEHSSKRRRLDGTTSNLAVSSASAQPLSRPAAAGSSPPRPAMAHSPTRMSALLLHPLPGAAAAKAAAASARAASSTGGTTALPAVSGRAVGGKAGSHLAARSGAPAVSGAAASSSAAQPPAAAARSLGPSGAAASSAAARSGEPAAAGAPAASSAAISSSGGVQAAVAAGEASAAPAASSAPAAAAAASSAGHAAALPTPATAAESPAAPEDSGIPQPFLEPFSPTPEEIAKAEETLRSYRQRVQDLQRRGQAKPDMVANKEATDTQKDLVGHVPGVLVGTRFENRGELSILGLHSTILSGIHKAAGPNKPATAICLSGGYKDQDEGHWMLYSGQGGKEKNRWVKDQTWTAGNAALRVSHQKGIPVRTMRAVPGATLGYTYDGMYMVHSATMETNEHGYLEARFRMVGIPGHFRAGGKVLPKQRRLGPSDDQAGAAVEAQARRTQVKRVRPGLIVDDFAQGRETVKIPVYNVHNDAVPPASFVYIRDSREAASESAKELDRIGAEATQQAGDPVCGLLKGEPHYNAQGHLKQTLPLGVFECGPECTAARCQKNKVVSRGVRLPLEIFHTGTECGWGVRCHRSIAQGTFIACYIGAMIDDCEAGRDNPDQLKEHEDDYLLDLHDFLKEQEERRKGESQTCGDRIPAVPEQLLQRFIHDTSEPAHCVLNAEHTGNLARFFNHSCGPNMTTQVVVIPGDNSISYRIGLVALETIPPLQELTWNYAYYSEENKGNRMRCRCGSAQCRDRD